MDDIDYENRKGRFYPRYEEDAFEYFKWMGLKLSQERCSFYLVGPWDIKMSYRWGMCYAIDYVTGFTSFLYKLGERA